MKKIFSKSFLVSVQSDEESKEEVVWSIFGPKLNMANLKLIGNIFINNSRLI